DNQIYKNTSKYGAAPFLWARCQRAYSLGKINQLEEQNLEIDAVLKGGATIGLLVKYPEVIGKSNDQMLDLLGKMRDANNRNVDFVHVGNYEMPVPDHWLVKVEPSGLTFLTDVRNRRSARGFSDVNVMTIDSLPTPARDLDAWKAYREQWLRANGVSNPEGRF